MVPESFLRCRLVLFRDSHILCGLHGLTKENVLSWQEEWVRWDKVHRAATTSLQDREGALERAAEEIEVDMTIVGATAIEDKLQDGVPDTIATLARAGIRIWVLTGDKQVRSVCLFSRTEG